MRTPLVIPILILLSLCACGKRAVDFLAESRALLKRDAEWAQLASAGKDVDRIVSYWADDAVVIEPQQPIYRGKAAIRAYVANSLQTPGFHIHWISEHPVFSPDGNLAWLPGKTELTMPGPEGKPLTLHLRGISIWRRDHDGLWRCVVDIANESPPI